MGERNQGGKSLRQIVAGEVFPATDWNHLRKRGIDLRDQMDAQIATVTKRGRLSYLLIRTCLRL